MAYNIIYPPTIDFEWMQQRPQQLMKEFAKLGHTVHYCQQHQTRGKKPYQVEPNLLLYNDADFLPPGDILWIGNPSLQHTISKYRCNFVVYDCCDDFYEHWGKNEDDLTKKADIVIVTAQKLLERKSKEKGQGKR